MITQDEKIKSNIQELLTKLNLLALQAGVNDYGLPIYDENSNKQMSECVYNWLINIIVNVDKREYVRRNK